MSALGHSCAHRNSWDRELKLVDSLEEVLITLLLWCRLLGKNRLWLLNEVDEDLNLLLEDLGVPIEVISHSVILQGKLVSRSQK